MEPAEASHIVDDLFQVDPETGEILAVVTPHSTFCVDTPEAAEWVLRKILEAESEVRAVEGRADVIAAKAIVENAERICREKQKRVEYLKNRFSPELAQLAAQLTAGKSSRTIKTPYGSYGLARVAGRLQEREKGSAATVALAAQYFQEAVERTESFKITRLEAEHRALIDQVIQLEAETRHRAAYDVVWQRYQRDPSSAHELAEFRTPMSDEELEVGFPLAWSLRQAIYAGDESSRELWEGIIRCFEVPADRENLKIVTGVK